MVAAFRVCLYFFAQVAIGCFAAVDELDSVVTEAAELRHDKRDAKQYVLQPVYGYYPLVNLGPAQGAVESPSSHSLLATEGPCRNSKGEQGKCVEFRKCYPYYKVPNVGNFDTWVLGMFDTCSYYTPQGRQVFGVCCAGDPSATPETAADRNVTESSAKIPNWPPPLPTHPPDHTIPPLPTHAPNPALYPGSTTTKRSTTPGKPGTSTTTTRKPTTKKPTYEIGSAACGAKNGIQDQGKIVGGHNADVNEWPWIAALFNAGRQFCGGSLIDNIHILSAAHCVAHMSSWDVARVTVRLGDYNIKTNSEVQHVEKKVKRVVRHRGFDSRTLYNDIAILTLDSPVEFNSVIRPVCLPSAGSRDWAGSIGTVIGWGSIRESGPQPAILQEVNIPIWSNTDCKQKYGHAAPGGIVEHMLCAGQANKDSCSGDSGGPLMVNSGRYTQVGIVSWGIGCGKGQYPGVYTRVEKFLPWIYKNLKQ